MVAFRFRYLRVLFGTFVVFQLLLVTFGGDQQLRLALGRRFGRTDCHERRLDFVGCRWCRDASFRRGAFGAFAAAGEEAAQFGRFHVARSRFLLRQPRC